MTSSGVYTDKTFETPMLFARWDKGIRHRTLTFTFDVTRNEIIRQEFPTTETAWDPKDYAQYLSKTSGNCVCLNWVNANEWRKFARIFDATP